MTASQTLVPLDANSSPTASGGTGTFAPRRLPSNDAGMSLVEIIVMVFILSLIGVGLTTMFINMTVSQQHVAARDKATGQMTTFNELFASSVRNAVEIRVRDNGNRIDTTMWMSDGTNTWFECRSWAVKPGGDLVYSSGKTPRSESTNPWSTLATDVAGALPGTDRAFSQSGKQVDVGLAFAPQTKLSEADAIILRTSITMQARHNEKDSAVTPCLGG